MKNFKKAIDVAAGAEEVLSDVSLPLKTALTCRDYASLIGCLKQAEAEAEMLTSQIRWAIRKIKNLEVLDNVD